MLKKIPSTSEMQHFTAEEFSARMDEILDTITKEDTAYIIDTDKGPYVICPAHWFDILQIRRESNYLATYTVQYALLQNRETAELVCADIRRRMYTFSYGTVEKMIADVTAFLKEHPDNEAAAAWNALVTACSICFSSLLRLKSDAVRSVPSPDVREGPRSHVPAACGNLDRNAHPGARFSAQLQAGCALVADRRAEKERGIRYVR